MNNKHAYFIMTHNEFELLKRLIRMIDDERNDIYVHIDKKVKDYSQEEISLITQKSKIYFMKRMNITWGGDSQIKCFLHFLQISSKTHYAYYHWISGVDFPLKSQDYIHDFFKKNNGKIYLDADLRREHVIESFEQRNKYYYFFQNKIGKDVNIYATLQVISVKLQEIIGINRISKAKFNFEKGSNWCSITDEAVSVILSSENFIKKYFFNALNSDESCIQTILYNSSLKDKIVRDDLRYIDWSAGGMSPRVLDDSDFETLKTTKDLFARKFSCKNEKDIMFLDKLEDYIDRMGK